MPKAANGTIWKILGFAVTVLVLAGSIIYGYATMGHTVRDNCGEISELKPEVHKNSEHRLIDELNTTYMEKRFDRLETGLEEFSTEQRAVNTQILRKLEK